MITDSFCELQYDEQHQCHYCKNCICKKGDVYYEGHEQQMQKLKMNC